MFFRLFRFSRELADFFTIHQVLSIFFGSCSLVTFVCIAMRSSMRQVLSGETGTEARGCLNGLLRHVVIILINLSYFIILFIIRCSVSLSIVTL